MQFRLLWSFLFISENPLTLGNILYKTLFWKQFNSSKFVSMKVIIIGRAICHTRTVTPVILRLRCSQMGNGSAIASGEQNFLLEREDLPSKCSKLRRIVNYLQLLHHLFGCILHWISMVVEVWVFQKGDKRTKDCRNGCMCTSSPMVTWVAQGNPFLLKVAASFIANWTWGFKVVPQL